MLEKRPVQSSTKDSESENSERVSIHTEASGSKKQYKKSAAPKHVKSSGLMIVEQIQNLIANAVKEHLGEGLRRTWLYTKPHTKRIDALCMPNGYQPPNF